MGSVTFRKITLYSYSPPWFGACSFTGCLSTSRATKTLAPQALDWNLVSPRGILLPYKNPLLALNIPSQNLVSTTPWDTILISNIKGI